jgi:hypothetical protein
VVVAATIGVVIVDATRVDVTADTVVNTADPAILSEERP